MSELTVRMGENIRIYRRANRMTLSELATKINKSKATVGKYEQGTIALDMDTLYEIAAALGVSPFDESRVAALTEEELQKLSAPLTCSIESRSRGPAGSSAASWSRARRTTP